MSAKPTTATAFLPNRAVSIGESRIITMNTIFSMTPITLCATSATFVPARFGAIAVSNPAEEVQEPAR